MITAVFGNKAQDKRKAARKAQRKAFRQNSKFCLANEKTVYKFFLLILRIFEDNVKNNIVLSNVEIRNLSQKILTEKIFRKLQ